MGTEGKLKLNKPSLAKKAEVVVVSVEEVVVVMVEEVEVVMVEEMVVMVEEMVVMVEEMVVSVEEAVEAAAEVEVVITAIKMGTWLEIVQSLTVGIVNKILQMFQFVYSCLVIRCPGLVCWLHRQSYSSMESC